MESPTSCVIVLYVYNIKNTTQMIDHPNCFDNKAPTIKSTSLLIKNIISRINYLLLAMSRIDLSIDIPPHFFTLGMVNIVHTYKAQT